MNEIQIREGQIWLDLDERNSKRDGKNGKGKLRGRRVRIVSLPTLSRKGVMEVVEAPMNPKSVGQKREFTRGKLLSFYGLITDGGRN